MVSDSFKIALTLISSFNTDDHIHIELNGVKDGATVTLDQRVVTCHGMRRTIALNTANPPSTKGQWTEALSCDKDDQVVFKVEQFNTMGGPEKGRLFFVDSFESGQLVV